VSASPVDPIAELYSSHRGWLQGWLRKKVGCLYQAADIVQDTFVKLLALPQLPVLREPRAYLLVTANHLLINQFRRRKLEEETLRTMAILAEDSWMHSPEEIAATRQLLKQTLLLLVRELDEKPRRAFLLARVDGMSYAEIAVELDVSESSVKQYLAKVLAHCHARLHALNAHD
jgi:RNA polymerase sigma factor (sigma-70 family)